LAGQKGRRGRHRRPGARTHHTLRSQVPLSKYGTRRTERSQLFLQSEENRARLCHHPRDERLQSFAGGPVTGQDNAFENSGAAGVLLAGQIGIETHLALRGGGRRITGASTP